MSETHIPMIYQSLTAAAAAINAVGKNGVNGQQGWKFRSIDDVYNALNPALIAAGLTVVPRVVEKDIIQDPAFVNQYGKQQTGATTARLTMEYTVFAQDGSSISAVVVGEGRDAGDKACNKAMAIAYKYFAFQTFCIPTEEMRLADPDLEIPDTTIHSNDTPLNAQKGPYNAQESKTRANTQPKADGPKNAGKGPKNTATVSVVKTEQESKPSNRLSQLTKLSAMLKTNMAGLQQKWNQLILQGLIPSKATKDLTDDEFTGALEAMRKAYLTNG